MNDETRELLEAIVEDFENDGCDGMGTISVDTINRVRNALGLEPLGDDEED